MDSFIDPSDGEFDVSEFLLNKRGFLLNPMVITEPSIGYGGGGTLLFFHEQAGEDEREEGEVLGLPPSISFAVAGGTETSSWLGAGGHFGSFRQDRIRYIGSAGYASLNIDFYVNDRDLDYGLDGLFVFNQLDFRLGDMDFFLGGRQIYTHLESEFDIPPVLSNFLPDELTFGNPSRGPDDCGRRITATASRSPDMTAPRV
jgi:hypothetical protein